MHSLIYFVVEAEEEGEALAKAEDYAIEWSARGVDYYCMPNDAFFKLRWGVRKVLPVDSEEGKKLVKELIETNTKVMREEFNKAKEAMDKQEFEDALYLHVRRKGKPKYTFLVDTQTGRAANGGMVR